MTIPICIPVPLAPDAQRVTLPGGVALEAINLMPLLQPALAPLVPIFDLVEAVVAVMGCFEAVSDALGPPPDPTKLASCLEELQLRVEKLLGLVPQLSLPLMVVGILEVMIRTLEDAKAVLRHLETQTNQILSAVNRANELGDANRLDVLSCAQGNVEREAQNVAKQLASLGQLIALTNVFLGLIGQDPIPEFSSVTGSLSDQIAIINGLIDSLQATRDLIPL